MRYPAQTLSHTFPMVASRGCVDRVEDEQRTKECRMRTRKTKTGGCQTIAPCQHVPPINRTRTLDSGSRVCLFVYEQRSPPSGNDVGHAGARSIARLLTARAHRQVLTGQRGAISRRCPSRDFRSITYNQAAKSITDNPAAKSMTDSPVAKYTAAVSADRSISQTLEAA